MSSSSSSSSKNTIVIVPGAWQKPEAWDILIQKLADAGHVARLVPLPSVGGTETILTGLKEDVAAVQAVLSQLKQDGQKPPLLLCHSSGGVVGSNVAQGHTVAGIIFLSAFVLPEGKSLLDMLGGQPLPWMDVQVRRMIDPILLESSHWLY